MKAPPVHLERLHYWSLPIPDVLNFLETTQEGLSVEVSQPPPRAVRFSPTKPHRDIQPTLFLIAQFQSPIVLLLLFAAIVSHPRESHGCPNHSDDYPSQRTTGILAGIRGGEGGGGLTGTRACDCQGLERGQADRSTAAMPSYPATLLIFRQDRVFPGMDCF